jgi:hypothetical protein
MVEDAFDANRLIVEIFAGRGSGERRFKRNGGRPDPSLHPGDEVSFPLETA